MIDRRAFLGSGLLLGVAGCSRALADVPAVDAAVPACPPRGPNAPLAQDYTIAAQIPADGKHYYMHDPGMTVLPGGAIFVAAPLWQVTTAGARDAIPGETRVLTSRSDDGGRTWTPLPPLVGMSDATPFVHDGALYMFLQTTQFGALLIVKSVDRGQTWSTPTRLFDATVDRYWNCSTPVLAQNGKLYWVVQQGPGFRGDVHVIAADLSKDLLDAASWHTSAPLQKPATPWGIVPNTGSTPGPSIRRVSRPSPSPTVRAAPATSGSSRTSCRSGASSTSSCARC